ncbi:hypothetical protein V7S43_005563 [Phytophthora oleae]|uniref:Uncharacterized protein n=1 Tax=Phytophthora oleae TaxID=2107226 RepID=A0ABD3FSA4_9STRA
MKLHEQLVRGGIINTKCISNPDMPMKRFKLGNSKDFCFFSHDDLSRDMLQSGPYHIMRASNFESMDSFYYDPSGFKRMMLVFQTIVSSRFPVKGKGIVALLRAVGWLDKAQKDPTRVALMFVCVDESEKVIDRKQPIQWTPAVDGESVTVIPGIGDPMMTSLGRINVQTLGDFRSKISELKRSRKDWLLKCVKFEKFEEDQRLEWEMISRMPQYVWKM